MDNLRCHITRRRQLPADSDGASWARVLQTGWYVGLLYLYVLGKKIFKVSNGSYVLLWLFNQAWGKTSIPSHVLLIHLHPPKTRPVKQRPRWIAHYPLVLCTDSITVSFFVFPGYVFILRSNAQNSILFIIQEQRRMGYNAQMWDFSCLCCIPSIWLRVCSFGQLNEQKESTMGLTCWNAERPL